MIELDYAFLADYAVVADGRLTVVGGSFVTVAVPMPVDYRFAVAGRIRASLDVESFDLQFSVKAPGYEISTGGVSRPGDPDSTTYADKRSTLFVLNTVIPLVEPGLYEIFVGLNGETVRRLAFEAVDLPIVSAGKTSLGP